MDTLATLTDTLLLRLAWTSVQATLLIGVLWLLGRALPRLPTPTRCLLWWLLGAQLLVGLVWQAPIGLPLLPPAPTTVRVAQTPRTISTDISTTSAAASVAHTRTDVAGAGDARPWREVLAALWLSGLLAQLALVARQWQRTRRIRRQSKALEDPRLRASCAEQAQRLGLRHCPQLRVSNAIDSPQVTGLWHPVILLPAHSALSRPEQTMTLAHELAHVRRGDLWLGWIPALAKGLFFFHPLVRLAMREYALHREAACDSAAVHLQRTAPQAYGRLLLRLGVDRPEPVGLAGVASPSLQQLKRRLAMLQRAARATPGARDWLLVALVALACIVPYRVVEAGGGAQVTRHAAQTADDAFILPPPSTAGAKNTGGTHSDAASGKQACEVAADNIGFCGSHFLWYGQPAKPGQGVVFFDKHHVIIHGTHADVVAAKHFYKPGASALWFRRGNKAWVTRDEKIIGRAWQIYAPMLKRMEERDRLTDEQSALTDKQSAIASQQSAFAQKQAALAQQRAALARKRAELAQKQASMAQQEMALQRGSAETAPTTTAGKIDAERKSIATRQRALDAQQHALNAQHARLAQQHAELEARLDGRRQSLARQRTELVKQRRTLASQRRQAEDHAHEAMRQLLDDVLAKGLAARASHD